MPRNRSAGRSAPRMAPRPAARSAPPPQPVHHAPPPAPLQSSGSGGSMLGGLASTVAQGVAFGTGSAIAHRAVDAIAGPRVIQHETTTSTVETQVPSAPLTTVGFDACTYQAKAFQDCLTSSGSDISKCQFYMDMLAECRKGSSASVTL